jgi:hypothetical protein
VDVTPPSITVDSFSPAALAGDHQRPRGDSG